MGRPKESRREEITDAINKHIMLVGPTEWETLRARFPGVSRATFFRYIKEAREKIEVAAVAKGPDELKLAQKRIRARVDNGDMNMAKVKAHLPQAPSPAVMAAAPLDSIKAFNFFAYFDKIVGDAELSRGASVSVAADGTERVKNPMMFDKNLQRRLGILDTFLKSVETVYNMERIRELYELIIDEVGKADPDVQQAVLVRLRELDNKRGITMNGRV